MSCLCEPGSLSFVSASLCVSDLFVCLMICLRLVLQQTGEKSGKVFWGPCRCDGFALDSPKLRGGPWAPPPCCIVSSTMHVLLSAVDNVLQGNLYVRLVDPSRFGPCQYILFAPIWFLLCCTTLSFPLSLSLFTPSLKRWETQSLFRCWVSLVFRVFCCNQPHLLQEPQENTHT